MFNVLAIDPGLSGGIAYVNSHGEVHAFDMPVCEYKLKSGKKRREVDVSRLNMIFHKYPSDAIVMEGLHGMPGMGGTQMFALGQSYGMVKASIVMMGLPYKLVTPQAWKKHFTLSKDKNASLARASEIFPGYKELWPLKKNDGRAEAALIAQYAIDNFDCFFNLTKKETE